MRAQRAMKVSTRASACVKLNGRVGGAERRARTASAQTAQRQMRRRRIVHASRGTASVRLSSEARERGAAAEAGPGARHNAEFCVAG